MKYTRTCEVCSHDFDTDNVRTVCCSTKCKQRKNNMATTAKRQAEFVEQHRDDMHMPTCKKCGWKAFTLVSHIRYDHNMTAEQYRQEYGVSDDAIYHPTLIQQKSERISGEHNPGYQHNGTMSSYSKNFTQYDGMSDEEKTQRIQEQAAKLVKTRQEHNNDATSLSYYTARGMAHEDAVEALAERQRTFTLEKCIEQYGEEDGRARWLDRQSQWLSSEGMLSLKKGVSKISQELFAAVADKSIHPCYYATNGVAGVNNEYRLRTSGGIVKLDFFVPGTGHIIEFDGDYWHSDRNPHNISTEVRDAKIRTSFPSYKIMHVYERDYRADKQGTITKCLEFLNA